jgi:hypothetical protein
LGIGGTVRVIRDLTVVIPLSRAQQPEIEATSPKVAFFISATCSPLFFAPVRTASGSRFDLSHFHLQPDLAQRKFPACFRDAFTPGRRLCRYSGTLRLRVWRLTGIPAHSEYAGVPLCRHTLSPEVHRTLRNNGRRGPFIRACIQKGTAQSVRRLSQEPITASGRDLDV